MKEIFDHYLIPPTDEEQISQTIAAGWRVMDALPYPRNSFMDLLCGQARYISPYAWVMQVLVLSAALLISRYLPDPRSGVQRLIFSTTPLMALAVLPELTKSIAYRMTELENVCRNSGARILAARLFVLGSVSLLGMTALSAFVALRYQVSLLSSIVYGLVPFNVVVGASLIIFRQAKIRGFVPAGGVSVALAVLMSQLTGIDSFYTVSQRLWALLCLGSLLWLGLSLAKYIRFAASEEGVLLWR